MADAPDQLLFSYAALQSAELQLDTFGRILDWEPDVLPGYTADYVEIEDSRFTDLTGMTVHPRLRATHNPIDKVIGRAMWVTEAELDAADQFEASMFRRKRVELASGRSAWVYVAD